MFSESQKEENYTQYALVIFSFLMALAMILAHYLVHVKRIAYLNEGSISLTVGMIAGGIYFLMSEVWGNKSFPRSVTSFDKEVFFLFLLPNIFINAGYRLKKRLFFQNFVTLTLMGVIGTFMSAAMLGSGAAGSLKLLNFLNNQTFKQVTQPGLKLGIVLSSTDALAVLQILDADKQPLLYSLVFGEGVVNDATTIVLLKAFQQIFSESQEGFKFDRLVSLPGNFLYLFICSLFLGIAAGLISALIIRTYFLAHHSTDREVFLTILSGIIVYVVAEAIGLSGIFAIFFCGITMSHYTYHSLSKPAQAISIYFFRILSFGAETFMFLYSGFDVWGVLHTDWQQEKEIWPSLGTQCFQTILLSVFMILMVYASRFIMVFSLVQLVNIWRKRSIQLNETLLIWWGGAFRGSVTIALLYYQFGQTGTYEQTVLVGAGTVVVIFTTLGMSIPTKAITNYLFQDSCRGEKPSKLQQKPQLGKVSNLQLYRNTAHNTYQSIHRIWRDFDHELIQPVFGGREAAQIELEAHRLKNIKRMKQKDNISQQQNEHKNTLYQLLIQEEEEEEVGTPGTSNLLPTTCQPKMHKTYSIEVKPEQAKQLLESDKKKKDKGIFDNNNLFNDMAGNLDEIEENDNSDIDSAPSNTQQVKPQNTSDGAQTQYNQNQYETDQAQKSNLNSQDRHQNNQSTVTGTSNKAGSQNDQIQNRSQSIQTSQEQVQNRRQSLSKADSILRNLKSPFRGSTKRDDDKDSSDVWQLH